MSELRYNVKSIRRDNSVDEAKLELRNLIDELIYEVKISDFSDPNDSEDLFQFNIEGEGVLSFIMKISKEYTNLIFNVEVSGGYAWEKSSFYCIVEGKIGTLWNYNTLYEKAVEEFDKKELIQLIKEDPHGLELQQFGMISDRLHVKDIIKISHEMGWVKY